MGCGASTTPFLEADYGGSGSPPVDAHVARAFINALRAEYLHNVGEAVGKFHDSYNGKYESTLDSYENRVRESYDHDSAIRQLENQWGLTGGPHTTHHPPPAAIAPPPPSADFSTAAGTQGPRTSAEAQQAMRSEDMETVRSAIRVAPKFGLVGSPNYQSAEARLRAGLQLPPDWDIASFANGRFLSGATGGRQASSVIATQKQPPQVVQEFQALFDATYRKVYTRDRRGAPIADAFVVKSVHRVLNDQVWREYSKCREEVRRKLEGSRPHVRGGTETMKHLAKRGAAAQKAFPAADTEVNEHWLYHGTNAAAAKGIIENDFRLDLSGSNAGTLYGRGIYLAEHCSKSDEYGETPLDTNGEEQRRGYEVKRPKGELPPLAKTSYMLLCRSMLGKYRYCDQRRPDADDLQKSCLDGTYDSVLGDRLKLNGTFREIMVYHDDRVYPEYVIEYERVYFHERFAEIYMAMLGRQKAGRFHGPTKEERHVLESLWNVYGMPNNGKINKWQLLDLLLAIGQPPENEGADLDETFKEWNTSGSGWIDKREFMQEMETRVRDGIGIYA